MVMRKQHRVEPSQLSSAPVFFFVQHYLKIIIVLLQVFDDGVLVLQLLQELVVLIQQLLNLTHQALLFAPLAVFKVELLPQVFQCLRQDSIMRDDTAVLAALILRKRVCIPCFSPALLLEVCILFSFTLTGLNQSLLLNDYLFQGPAPHLPPLDMSFQLLIAHLPPLDFFSYLSVLFVQLLYLVLYCPRLHCSDCFNEGLHAEFSLPSHGQLVLKPFKYWSYFLLEVCLRGRIRGPKP